MWNKYANRLPESVFGAAVGDALGVPYEFKIRESFSCTDMVGYGSYDKPAGTWSDDTAMTLATCASLVANQGCIDVMDIRMRFEDWFYAGSYAIDGITFDVGKTTARAIQGKAGLTDERSCGNGSLMRIAPLAFTDCTDDEIAAVCSITHAHRFATQACVCFVHTLRDVLASQAPLASFERHLPHDEAFSLLPDLIRGPRQDVCSSGYVIHTLGAALWCITHTSSFEECVLAAVNLGDDSDTNACVAGALAAALYGPSSIPDRWLNTLRGKELIDSSLGSL